MTYEEIDELQHKAYKYGYDQGVQDFAKKIKDKTKKNNAISKDWLHDFINSLIEEIT